MPKNLWLISALIGVLLSALIVGVGFLGIGGSMVGALISFSAPSAYLIGTVIPSEFWYWVAPEGGGPAAIRLFTAAAWLQLAVVLSVAARALLKIRRRHVG